ncbi:MAG: hypothetical protein QM762_04125 [Chryseolinea sp.]
MAVYQIKNKSIGTSGQALQGFINGLGDNRETGLEVLSRHGIVNPKADQWYSLHDYLQAFRELESSLGPAALYSIGSKIPESAALPPEIDTIEKALGSLDIAYHMNHAIDGQPMFNPATGKKLSGMGGYEFKITGDGEAEITADNPYPTSFDEGLIFAMAQRFNPASMVQVIEERSSRSKGGDKDVYTVQWF